jgi:hypothetical protein
MGIPVFFAGDAFGSERNRLQVPGRYLGASIEGACAMLIDAMHTVGQNRSTAAQGPQPGTTAD